MESVLFTLINALFCSYTAVLCRRGLSTCLVSSMRNQSMAMLPSVPPLCLCDCYLLCHITHALSAVFIVSDSQSIFCLSPVIAQKRSFMLPPGSFILFKYHTDIWSNAFIARQLISNVFLSHFHWLRFLFAFQIDAMNKLHIQKEFDWSSQELKPLKEGIC